MDLDRLMGRPTSVSIIDVVEESAKTRTLKFRCPFDDTEFHSGQFMMVWLPGVDEIPMSVSYWNPPDAGVTVAPIGEATNALVSLKLGQLIGIRGPFGTAFKTDSKKALVVGGGVGMAPLRPLTYELLNQDSHVTLLLAAKTKRELVYLNEFESLNNPNLQLQMSTDDGSMGYKGLATEATEEILARETPDAIYTCGPELMMFGLYEQAKEHKIAFQASLERFMKCGCGICGTCALDPTGDLVCIEGAIFDSGKLSNITEFGKYHRDLMGLKKQC
ncbi:MAG: dihydroorotate dehydrogenase electron transfer subunit [Candidatus Thorarchaeota archaeon]|jgi:dihydroorotate dehydrogenase electron transfer subunit